MAVPAVLGVTEMRNFLTSDLDVSVDPVSGQAEALLRLLRESDAQLFAGFSGAVGQGPDGWPSVYDAEIVGAVEAAARGIGEGIARARADPCNVAVIALAGAGTSGRLSFFVCRAFTKLLQEQDKALAARIRFVYLAAGGDYALLRAREKSEDNVELAQADLRKAVESALVNGGEVYVSYIGVTCGLSAPYVAGQLAALFDQATLADGAKPYGSRCHVTSASLLGFNPIELARRAPIEGWDRTFADVVKTCFGGDGKAHPLFHVVNPVVGPEPLTGSTRMKGGTATKICLEVILLRALHFATVLADVEPAVELFMRYEETYRCIYDPTQAGMAGWSTATAAAGATLVAGGRILYFSQVPTFGILGFIDASECPPTFGASGYDVRGFVANGWETLENQEGDLLHEGDLFACSIDGGLKYLQETLGAGKRCTAIVLSSGAGASEDQLSRQLRQVISTAGATDSRVFVCRVECGGAGDLVGDDGERFTLRVPAQGVHAALPLASAEMGLKLVLNAISLGAHVAKGKVIENVMADLGLSNNKLFERATRIVAEFAKASTDAARVAVLRAIWQTDGPVDEFETKKISEHIDQAATVRSVVPTAMLLASGRAKTLEECRALLQREPVVRRLLREF